MIFNIFKIIVKNWCYCYESVVFYCILIMGEILVDYIFKILDGKI